MTCPECGGDTRVINNARYDDEDPPRVWRRRECTDCGHRFSTDERPREARATPGGGDGDG